MKLAMNARTAGSESAAAAADAESQITDDPHETERLWLRLLTCTLMIEHKIRARLRGRHERWLQELLAAVPPARRRELHAGLGELKAGLGHARMSPPDPPPANPARSRR